MSWNDNSLLDQLIDYGKSDMYPFHMPGHKRCGWKKFPNPYEIDITEIDGFDNLHHAEGILKESMERAAKIYGADRTFYLVNGSTCGILSAICACVKPGEEILVARNCHKSVYHGLLLQNIKAHYIYPAYLDGFGIHGSILKEDVEVILKKNPRIKAVLIVSPTYEGVVSDIQAIADLVHQYRIPLIVDEAHGAHFSFAKDGFPRSAVACGADVVIQSLHKTLPSLTQTAILHWNKGFADMALLERYLGIFQSSSPSYVFLAAIEQCVRYMDQDGRKTIAEYEAKLCELYYRLKDLKILNVLEKGCCKENFVYDRDMSKIVVSSQNTGMSGHELSELLRKQYHLEMEMSGPEYMIGMTTLMDTDEGLNRLADALLDIDHRLMEDQGYFSKIETESANGEIKCDHERLLAEELPKAEVVMTLAQAMHAEGKSIRLCDSAGMISQEFLYLYPPGIPILAPGERITKEIVERVAWYRKKGLSVQGLADTTVSSIITVAEE